MAMITAMTTNDETQTELKLSLKRERVERLLAMLDVKRANGGLSNSEVIAYEVATLRLYGAGASPKKFARLEAQQVCGGLRGRARRLPAANNIIVPRLRHQSYQMHRRIFEGWTLRIRP
jgi:hypothetical protein